MQQEVWLLWQDEQWYDPELLGIYSTEEIAEKHKKEQEDNHRDYQIKVWRENNNKHPTELPDYDIKPSYEFYIECWDVSTE